MHTHPTVLLSIASDTDEGADPPIEKVRFALECPIDVEPFLIPYIIAMQKAFHLWPLWEPALIMFNWSESARKADPKGHTSQRDLWVSINVAPRNKDELRFLVGGTDVRADMLHSRQIMRDLRTSDRKAFEELEYRNTAQVAACGKVISKHYKK